MKQKDIVKIGFRVLLLAALLVVFNFIYVKFFWEKDLQEHSEIINLVRDVQYKSDILYLAESSNASKGANDLYKESISQFIAGYYPDLRVGRIDKNAAHAGIFKVLLKQVPENDTNVKVVIVTLNLRSFGADWINSKLETALQKSTVLLRTKCPLYNRFILSFKGYDKKTEKERDKKRLYDWGHTELKFPHSFPYTNVNAWDYAIAQKGITDKDGQRNDDLTTLACHYVKSYAFQIDTISNPRIKDFNEIVKIARKRGWKLVFNLLAENTERGQELVGNELTWLMRQNRDLLVNYYTRKGVVVVDNLEAVHDVDYIDQNWTTEHYMEHGRIAIAKNVANALKAFYPEKYTEVTYNFETQSNHYFYNCDDDVAESKGPSITGEKAFSGKKSSKTGKESPYSITFEKTARHIPDTCLGSVHVSLRYWAENLDKDISLALDCGNDQIFYAHFIEKPFTTSKWDLFEHTFTLPDHVAGKNPILKVYVYNPTQNTVYIDDLDITFLK